VTAAKRRRDGRSTRRRGLRSPTRFPGRRGERIRQQATRGCTIPPCTAPRQLRDDEATAEAGNQLRRRLGFPVAHGANKGGGVGSGGEDPGGDATLNSPGTVPWRTGHSSSRAGVRLRAVARSDSGTSPAWGRRG
jgi:hypothetical protein